MIFEGKDKIKGQNNQLKKLIRDEATLVFKELMKTSSFTDRKLTDTPTDALQVVNRKYVTNNGPSASRPTASVVGQPYFDTTLGQPIWWDGTSFVDADGGAV